jgi:hypothetical protein
MKYVIDCTTVEETVREMTKVEITAEEASAKAYAQEMGKVEEEALSAASDKAALLNRLGITAEEAKLLLA